MPSNQSAPPKNQRSILLVPIIFAIVVCAGAAYLYTQSGGRIPAAVKNMPNPVATSSDAVGAGMMIYMDHCQNCHGESGDGKGKKAAELSIAPADFTDASRMGRQTDGELFWQITQGHLPMPAFKDKLTDEECWQVVTFIRTFANKPGAGAPGNH
jgi:mono/diheme cytochrome c family protein